MTGVVLEEDTPEGRKRGEAKAAALIEEVRAKQTAFQKETEGHISTCPIAGTRKRGKYHSLAVQEEGLPACLEVFARTEDGEIMAMRHQEYPVIGLQFHPESIYTEHGKRMIENFVNGNV